MSKIYTNQPLRVEFAFLVDGAPIGDITDCTVECELFAPGVKGTATDTITGAVDDGASATGYADIPAGKFVSAGGWKVQPYVTYGGTRWPAEVTIIQITDRGSVK